MNVSEFARQMGTSKTTLYRKIAAAGVDLAEYRDQDGNITDKGLSVLAALMDGSCNSHASHASHTIDTADGKTGNAERLRELERENRELREKLEAANARIDELQAAATARADAHAAELAAILKQQQENEAERLRMAAQAKQPGILGRLRVFLLGNGRE